MSFLDDLLKTLKTNRVGVSWSITLPTFGKKNEKKEEKPKPEKPKPNPEPDKELE